ncbi:MAG TPA: ABC transporter transmembrane domain-containing protein [Gammaproteobacteria bacterium]|nr:ABC transporter transmembrane domain-containing protein [Gammaproteobacteria bacterium]
MPGSRDAQRRPRSQDLRQLGLLWRFVRPYRARVLAAAAALLVAASSVLAIGQGLRLVIDRGIAAGNPGLLDEALIGLFVVILVMAAATFGRFYLVTWLGERVTADIRRAAFDHILELSPAFFELTRTGEVISRLTNDTQILETVIGSSASFALRNLLLMLGAIVMLALTSAKLTLLVLVGVPIVALPIALAGRRLRQLSRASQDRVADVAAYVDETLHEIRTVQAYVHEDADRVLFTDRVEAQFGTARRRILVRAAMIAAVILLSFSAIGAILWVGGHDVVAGRLSPGDLSAFVFYSVMVAGGVGAIAEVWGELQRAAGAAERLVELLATASAITAPPAAQELPVPPRGAVRFEAVSFSYPTRPAAPALHDFSLAVAAGEKVALVGPSGAGKTTVFQLLLRYYDPQAGSVRFDGVDARALDPRELRRHIALVPQEPVIFAASVRDNVSYGRPDASDADVEAACRAAFAWEFIERLPQGLASTLGERGVQLSGGQRQRLAIARAILAERPLLLLDEATSALDAESERLVQQALATLMRDHTTLIIAHRLATVQHADRIVVLDQGRIVEVGTHASLSRAGGLYAKLAALQFHA